MTATRRRGQETATARDRPPEEAQEDTSFARGLRLLLAIADRGEIRADELSGLLGSPVSTVYRYLRTLAFDLTPLRISRDYRLVYIGQWILEPGAMRVEEGAHGAEALSDTAAPTVCGTPAGS